MAILVPRTATPVEYAPEVIRQPGTRDIGVTDVVPQIIREAAPSAGITSAGGTPRLTTRMGTSQSTSLSPLVGAALGALAGNIISQRQQRAPVVPPATSQPGTIRPGGGTGGPGGRPGGGTGGGAGGTRPTAPVPGAGGYTGPVGIFTQNPDGTITQTMDDGSKITFDQNGNVVSVEETPEDNWSYDAESGTFYNSATGVYFDPETGAEQFPSFQGDETGGGYVDQPQYGYEYDLGGYYPNFGYEYDTGPDYSSQYDYSDLYDYYGGGSFYPDYSQDFGFNYGDSFGTGDLYGNYDYFTFFKDGGMATPMMKKGGILKMSNGGSNVYDPENFQYVLDTAPPVYDFGYGDYPVIISSDMPDQIQTTSADADAQPGGFYGSTPNTFTNPVTGEVFVNGIRVDSPGEGFSFSGALNSIADFARSYPGLSGAAIGALLSQVLSQPSGAGRENLGIDMSRYGVVAPRTTTFGVGAPRFVTYEQYGAPQRMQDLYGTELYKNLNAPGFNPVNPTPAMRKGGLAQMADGGQAYYTYGKPMNAADNLMAEGGQPMMGGGAPMVEGRMDYRHGSAVQGPGDGQSDDIPAMLADGEYVIDAETVAMLGNGSNKAGAEKLDEFRMNIRKHKRETPLDKIPPASKSPLSYLKGTKNG